MLSVSARINKHIPTACDEHIHAIIKCFFGAGVVNIGKRYLGRSTIQCLQVYCSVISNSRIEWLQEVVDVRRILLEEAFGEVLPTTSKRDHVSWSSLNSNRLLVDTPNGLHTREYILQKLSCSGLTFLQKDLIHMLLHPSCQLECKPVISLRCTNEHVRHLTNSLALGGGILGGR